MSTDTQENTSQVQAQNQEQIGQAAINSHTMLGSSMLAATAMGVDPLTPAVEVALTAWTTLTPPQAQIVARGIVTVGSLIWTWYGRMTAKVPITGIVKAGAQ